MWDLFSPTRDWTGVPCSGSDSVLTTESPRKSQPHVLVGCLCVQLQRRFIMTPRKGPRWGQKSSCFYRGRHPDVCQYFCASQPGWKLQAWKQSWSHCLISAAPHNQQEAHLLPETNYQHWSPFMQCRTFLLLFTCPAPPYRGSKTLHLGTGITILACSAFQTFVANITLILMAQSDPANSYWHVLVVNVVPWKVLSENVKTKHLGPKTAHVERSLLCREVCVHEYVRAEWNSLEETHYDGDIDRLRWLQDLGAFDCLCFCTIQIF